MNPYKHDFDKYVEGTLPAILLGRGRPGAAAKTLFRLLLIGYFEGLDAERAV